MAGRTTTKYRGVVYWERTRGATGSTERYYGLRYKLGGKVHEEPVGWSGDGWTAKACDTLMQQLRVNHATGTGPQNLREMREHAELARQAERAALAAANMAPCPTTFGQWLTESYIPSRRGRKSESTVRKDTSRANMLAAMPIGRLPVYAITSADVVNLLDDLRDADKRDGTLYQYYAMVRHAIGQASNTYVDGVALFSGTNPCDDVDFTPDPSVRFRFFSREQIEAVCTRLASEGHDDARDAALVSLHTGLRLGEIGRLQHADADPVHGQLYVRAKSTNKPGGMVPLNRTASEIFTRRAQISTDPRVFPPAWGVSAEATLSRAFRDAVNALGYNDGVTDIAQRLVFHSLRHTFASWLALAGTDIYRIKALMRHKTLAMTMRYAHLLPDSTRSAVLQLDDHG
ncbi:tyrosine-type recombinase/integrase [Nitratidesulfovibrio sp. 1201_IL3209]|uniref:tyrosine-type recombinase/integrase n=1 Tax=Nitratidesulfovibrio sp. 1201_IL3209 TaxID=3084053 RepID=UPI002FDAF046